MSAPLDRDPRPPAGRADRGRLPTLGRGRMAALALLCVLAISTWVVRAAYAKPYFHFLMWNLFLATIPWVAAWSFARARWRVAQVVSGLAWLLFLPNAPYLVTDLVHFRTRPPVPWWFDVMLFASFALAGCAFGWASLELVHRRLVRTLGLLRSSLAIAAAIVLSGFGVYLGRFERWNSWDLVTRPGQVLADCAEALHSPKALVFTALFAAFMGAGYLLFASRSICAERRAS
ncbi:MAG: DUF1361 domain-containing protein [Myxococcales bacterium]